MKDFSLLKRNITNQVQKSKLLKLNNMKTPFRKNLDKRYISGEDLQNGKDFGKGLDKEIVVTMARFNDAPAFDQKEQKEVDKTAIWLTNHLTGELIYKPCLLNVARAEFMAKELANNSLFLDDCDKTKPFVIYAKVDRRHGFIVAFKKYWPPITLSDVNAKEILNQSKTMDELKLNWDKITKEERLLPSVLALKETLKNTL
jgi:hypothetical protein